MSKFCICETPEYDRNVEWIGCTYRKKCVSYIERMDKDGVTGGDWFHLSCMNLPVVPDEEWACDKCHEKNSLHYSMHSTAVHSKLINLKLLLQNERREIVPIQGDGNCVFRAFSYCLFGTVDHHADVRKEISNELLRLADTNKFLQVEYKYNKGPIKLSQNTEEYDSEKHLLHQLLSTELTDVEKFYTRSTKTFAEALKIYANKMKIPAGPKDSAKVRFSKYGGNVEFAVFSSTYHKNIWVLRPTLHQDYKWFLVNSDVKRTYEENKNHPEYITMLFHPGGCDEMNNHYDAIKNEEGAPLPSDELVYTNQITKTETNLETITII